MADRAVSEVISYVLVFALIVSAVGIVSISGLASLQETRDAEQIQNAERAFDVLADNVADIHQRGAPSRATEISLGENQLYTGENVTMSVEITNSTGTYSMGSQRMRPIVYSGTQERQLVYEGAAVFRTNREGGLRIRDPPFIIKDDRVLLTVAGLNRPSAQSLGGSTVLVRTQLQDTDVAYSNTTGDVDSITVTIEDSPRKEQWERYLKSSGFEDTSGCDASDPSPLTCTFEGPGPSGNIDRVYIVYHDISVNIDP